MGLTEINVGQVFILHCMLKLNRIRVLIVGRAYRAQFLWQMCRVLQCYSKTGIFSTGIQKNAAERRQAGETLCGLLDQNLFDIVTEQSH